MVVTKTSGTFTKISRKDLSVKQRDQPPGHKWGIIKPAYLNEECELKVVYQCDTKIGTNDTSHHHQNNSGTPKTTFLRSHLNTSKPLRVYKKVVVASRLSGWEKDERQINHESKIRTNIKQPNISEILS